MFAVIETGGKQYKVKAGEVIKIEKLELGIGDTHAFDKVLLVSKDGVTEFGTPFLAGKTVTAEVIAQARDKKVKIIKFRRRKHHMKQQGHRQYYTALRVIGLN